MIKNIDYLHAFADRRHALSEDNILYRVACLLTTVGHYTETLEVGAVEERLIVALPGRLTVELSLIHI